MTSRERIAVTGVGAISALGADASSTFARLLAGDRAIREVSLFDTEGLVSRVAAEVSLPIELSARMSSRTDALALLAAQEALDSAGLAGRSGRLGISVGGTAGAMLETEADLLAARGNPDPSRARRLLTHPLSATAEYLARELGPACRTATVCSACSSGAAAITLGAHWLLAGHADAVLVGGADGLCRMTFVGFAALGVMDARPCRPFALDRAGLSLGEGAGFLVLELESVAERRRARVLAWLSGWAVGAEAHHATHPEPSGARAAALVRQALSVAEIDAEGIDYVNAHGTGTRANDAMEALALSQVFGGGLGRVRVSSSKAQLGHTLGAAGALEAVISVLSLEQGAMPPTAGLEAAEASELNLLREAERAPLRAVLSNSFGFGGLDAALIFEHREASRRAVTALPRARLVLSGAALLSDTSADPLAELSPERSRRFDGLSASTTRAAELALLQAQRSPTGVGLVAGNAYGPVERSLRFLDRCFERGLRQAPPAEFPHLVQSAAAGNAAIYLALNGPVFAICEGATSGESAFAAGLGLIEQGACTAVLVGAAEPEDQVVAALVNRDHLEASDPRRHGAGFVLLETAEAARARGHTPLARLDAHEVARAGHEFSSAILRAPREPASARVLLAGSEAFGVRELAGSGWGHVARRNVQKELGHFEAVGAAALTLAVEAIREGASEVLVLGLGAHVRYLTRLAAPELG